MGYFGQFPIICFLLQAELVLQLGKLFDIGAERYGCSQLKFSDIQELVLFTTIGCLKYNKKPQWIDLGNWPAVHNAVLVLLSAVGTQLFEENKDCFPKICKHFEVVGGFAG